jgi:uncharacterized protein (DUF849 family)
MRLNPEDGLVKSDEFMSTAMTASGIERQAELLRQTVVVIGGSARIGLETARRAVRGRLAVEQYRPQQ